MRPSPSLHYVATLLDQRRRRHHRVRRLWSIGLLLLGLGLPLVGWWGTCRLAPRAAPPAAARAGAVEPTRPAGTRGISLEPRPRRRRPGPEGRGRPVPPLGPLLAYPAPALAGPERPPVRP